VILAIRAPRAAIEHEDGRLSSRASAKSCGVPSTHQVAIRHGQTSVATSAGTPRIERGHSEPKTERRPTGPRAPYFSGRIGPPLAEIAVTSGGRSRAGGSALFWSRAPIAATLRGVKSSDLLGDRLIWGSYPSPVLARSHCCAGVSLPWFTGSGVPRRPSALVAQHEFLDLAG